jgi:ABC-type proline/glycine betaine transport system permease subunit
MIVELFHGVRWVDVTIHRKLGFAYNALLGIGLVVEIYRHLHEARDLDSTNMIRTILSVALFALLLLHQLAELAEHVDRRFRKSKRAG